MFREAVFHFKGSLAVLQNDSKIDIPKSESILDQFHQVKVKEKEKNHL